ncbi:TPA: hypothetical protein ACJHJJ_003594 [Bacillus cereus]|uniref:helix-turn-helix transcriptional regulator n=1 Tax=Bacillus cereus TaxID=1396 RepID=UPI0020418281|nr:helix-turn-helix transcriptional regulator [Bacillus cereus]MCM3200923.1 helix-turn-helix domain-containing protein [Bacillus cereus]
MEIDLSNLSLGEKLRLKRRLGNLSQVQLCLELGLSHTDVPVISQIENGHIEKLPKKFVEPINKYLDIKE